MVDKSDKKPDANEVKKAKVAFFVGLFDLTWKLAGAMLIPIFIGLFIDSKNGGKTFAYIGFIIGIIGGILVLRNVILKLSKDGESSV